MKNRPQQLAEAFVSVAKANHYMVGIVEPYTLDELEEAQQLLIRSQSSLPRSTREWLTYDLALDIAEQKRTELLAT